MLSFNTGKLFLLTSFIISFYFPALAQTAIISGKITDQNNEPLTGAVAELLAVSDSSLVKINVADVTGIYSFEKIKPGNYFLKISFLGFETFLGNAFIFNGNSLEMPVIKLRNVVKNLQQANVTAFKPLVEVRSDKTVFNVENSVNAVGNSAFELLQKAPGVVIDNNDNLYLKGRSGVLIQIDGKSLQLTGQELADLLKSMQSTDVEAIELISNPSSKYDAEGTAGIINIKLKKNKNLGTNGNVTLGYAIGKYSKYNTAISLNNRSKKINTYVNYSNNWGKRFNEFNLYREQNPYIFTQTSPSVRDPFNHNYKTGADFTVNKKHSMGAMVFGNYSTAEGYNDAKNTISNFTTHSSDSILNSFQTFTSFANNINANINHRYADTLGHELTTDVDAGFYTGERKSLQPNIYTLPDGSTILSEKRYRTATPTEINIYTVKTDYNQTFLKGKLGLGIKLSLVETDNTYEFFNIIDGAEINDLNRSNHFVYTEKINAGYINYQRTINKFDLQAGLRTELTSSEGDLTSATTQNDKNVKRSYTDFFPSGGITFNLNKNNSFALIYSRRIDRPNYRDLNPFEFKLDELSFQRGNPFLNPQYTNNIELSHTYKYTVTTSIGYSRTTDFFAQITDTLSEGKSYLTSRNLATEEIMSANFSASWQPKKWYSLYLNIGGVNQHYNADFGNGKTINTSVANFNLYAQNTFKLPFDFSIEVSGWYNSAGVWGGSYKTEAQGSLDLGLQKKLFKDQSTLKLSATDIFHTAPWRSTNTYAGIVIKVDGSWESQQFKASLSWRFGNKQMKSIRQRTSGSEAEQKRTGGGE